MSKLISAARLLASGDFGRALRRLRINLRTHRLRRAAGRTFAYRLNGFRFVCVPGLSESEDIFLTGECDELEVALLRRWLEPGDAFVDIGANLGLYSFATRQFLGSGNVLGIEASPELHRQLCASAELLGLRDIRFEQAVVGDRDAEIDFFLAPPDGALGEQGLHPDPARSRDFVPRRMRMRTLADILRNQPVAAHPQAVKLDIEGAEPLALRGAPSSWFGPTGPLWIVEVNPTALARSRSSPRELVNQLPAESFDRWLLPQFAKTGARHLPSRRLLAGESFEDAWFYNLVAVPRDAEFERRRVRLGPLLAQ